MSCCTGRRGKESKARRGEIKDAERRRFNQLKEIELVRIHCNDDGYYHHLDKPPIVHLGPINKRQVTTCNDDRTDQQSIYPQIETASVTSSRKRDSMYSTFKGLTTLPGSEFYQLRDIVSPDIENCRRMTQQSSFESDQASTRNQEPTSNCDALGIHYPSSGRPQLPPFPWELPQRPTRVVVREPRNSDNVGESGCTENLFSRIPRKPGYRDLSSNRLPPRRTPVVPTRSSSLRSNRNMSSRDRRPVLSYRESQEFLRPRPAPSVPSQGQRRSTMEPLRINTSVHNERPNSSRGTQQRPSQAFLPENQRPPRTSASSRNHHSHQPSTGRRTPIVDPRHLTPLRPPPPPPIRRRPVGAPQTIRVVPRSPPARLPGSRDAEQEVQQGQSNREGRQIVQQPPALPDQRLSTENNVRALHVTDERSYRPSRFKERLDSNGVSPCSPEQADGDPSWKRYEVSPLSPVVPPGDEILSRRKEY